MKLWKGLRFAAGACGISFAFFVVLQSASAATLTVGPGRMYAQPAGAAAAAKAGDIIQIYPGTYSGAAWKKPNLTIIGMGPNVVITGGQVLGKGLFVIDGANITIQNITFKNAHSAAGNGAGIRQDKTGLSIINSRFYGNQDGILTANDPTMTLNVSGSTFGGNGACAGSCAHALYAGHIASLTVTNSTFNNTQKGHDIKSRANSTTLTGNKISDGPTGTSSYLVDIPNGGALRMTGNTLEKGPLSSNYSIAVSLGEEGASNPQGPMLIANNTFRNDGRPTVFVSNRTGYAGLVVSANILTGNKTIMLQGKGTIGGPLPVNGRLAARGGMALFALAAPLNVPEPSSLVLFAAAAALLRLFGVLWARRAL